MKDLHNFIILWQELEEGDVQTLNKIILANSNSIKTKKKCILVGKYLPKQPEMAIQDGPNDKYLSISRLKYFFLHLTNLFMIYHIINKPIIANYCIATSLKSYSFSILDSAYAILVLCSRQVLVMFKDHPSKLVSSIGSH